MSDEQQIAVIRAELELKFLYQQLSDLERLGHDTSRLKVLIREATIRSAPVFEAARDGAYTGTPYERPRARRPARACCKSD